MATRKPPLFKAPEYKGAPLPPTIPEGGHLEGPSHEEGGIPIVAEGGEIMININKNGASVKHKEKLLALNDDPDAWEIVPVSDARERRNTNA